MEATAEEVRAKVRERYSIAASRRGCCEDDGCCAIGYSPVELEGIPAESVLGLGSGNPVRHAELRPGEAFRILKPGGRLVISDVVQERDLGRIEDDCGCVGNAMVRGEYLETIRRAGFAELRIVEDRPWRTGPSGIEASAVTLIARKPGREVKM